MTLGLDSVASARFDALRREHFPPERNLVPAHLTLFHRLPGCERDAVMGRLRDVAAVQKPFALQVTDVRFLGRGVAFALASAELATLRRQLVDGWAAWLGLQDLQPFRPHVTIQNKVAAETARDLYGRMAASFAPFVVHGTAFLLWQYRGGPWESVAEVPFPSHPGAAAAAATPPH